MNLADTKRPPQREAAMTVFYFANPRGGGDLFLPGWRLPPSRELT